MSEKPQSRIGLFQRELIQIVDSALPDLDSRTPGLMSPHFEGNFRTFTRKEEDLVILGVLHWWLPEDWRILVHLWLEDYHLQSEYKCLMNLVLKDKYIALMWLVENYHERRFFGNLVPLCKKLLESLRPLQVQERNPKRVQRKRGYQDHGSLRPIGKWLETHDWSFTELQNQIEAESQTVKDTADFLEGWFS